MNKNFLIPLIVILSGIFVGGALLLSGNENSSSLSANIAQVNLRKVNLEIANMSCAGCRLSVVNSVMALSGVVQADADTRTDSVWVIYDSAQITKEQIKASSIFQAYPARILSDQKYTNEAQQE